MRSKQTCQPSFTRFLPNFLGQSSQWVPESNHPPAPQPLPRLLLQKLASLWMAEPQRRTNLGQYSPMLRVCSSISTMLLMSYWHLWMMLPPRMQSLRNLWCVLPGHNTTSKNIIIEVDIWRPCWALQWGLGERSKPIPYDRNADISNLETSHVWLMTHFHGSLSLSLPTCILLVRCRTHTGILCYCNSSCDVLYILDLHWYLTYTTGRHLD
jgi:hypothetical protein